MKENVLLIGNDFSLIKGKDVLSDGHLALMGIAGGISPRMAKLGWIMIVIIVSGETSCTINGKEYALRAHDMLVALPDNILKSERATDDLSIKCICISRQLLEKSFSFSMYNWDVMSFLVSHSVLSLQEDEYARFSAYYELMSRKLENQQQLCYKESMQCLLKSFLFDFYGVVGRNVSSDMQGYSQGNKLFRSFLDLLSSVYPRPRSVSFYAGKLNVTPKYLSTVCKLCCGRTASAVIHKAVVGDISNLLCYSTKSIKEIMVELDFPSLSFFGKYVKRHLGMGPKEYRAKWLS